jgi:hypothetical protein
MAVRLKSAKLDLYIYTGNVDNIGDPKYTLVKSRLASEDTIVFEISELVRDYIDVSFTGNYQKLQQTAWVQTELTRTFENDTDSSTVEDPEPLTRKYIAFRGYGELYDINDETSEYVNPTLSKSALISNRTIFHLSGAPLYVPFYRAEDGVFDVKYKNNDSVITRKIYGGNTQAITTDLTSIYTDHTQSLDTTVVRARTSGSGDFSITEAVVGTIDEIVFRDKNGVEQVITVRNIEECKHTPYKISFMNKYGAIQDLWFFKRSDKSMAVEKQDFRKSTIQHLSTGTKFNTYDSPSELLQSTAKKMITMNTGFVTEDHNQVIKELLNTEYCWIHDGGDGGQLHPTPIKPMTVNFNEKQEVNEKLINFTVEFEYAHNFIQDIR